MHRDHEIEFLTMIQEKKVREDEATIIQLLAMLMTEWWPYFHSADLFVFDEWRSCNIHLHLFDTIHLIENSKFSANVRRWATIKNMQEL